VERRSVSPPVGSGSRTSDQEPVPADGRG
jgi:hypothetical protein